MKKEVITARQWISILILFIFGSSVGLSINTETQQDSWISLIVTVLFSLPLVALYGRIIKLAPGGDFYQLVLQLFGRFLGKGIILLYTWYALHLGALVTRNFSEFIDIVAMPETPQLALMIIFTIVMLYMAKSGIEILGKWSAWMAPFVTFIIGFTFILSLRFMKLHNLQPIMVHSLKEIATVGFKILAFPIGEIVLFLPLATAIREKDSPYRILYGSVLFSSFVLLAVLIRIITTLGIPMTEDSYFPSYVAVSIIRLGDFFSRIEGSISVNLILACLPKASICVLAASRGIARLFNLKDEKYIVAPVGLWTLALCAIIYENVMEMFHFTNLYHIYVFPFQVLLPLIIWIFAEIKARKEKKSTQSTS